MGDSSDSDRPLKRVKYARREELHDELHDEPKPIVTLPVTMNPRPSVPTNGFPDLREGPVFDNPWIVPPTLPSPTQGLLTLATENANTPWVSAPSDSHDIVFDAFSPTAGAQYQDSLNHQFAQPARLPRLLPAVPTPVVETVSGPQDSLRQRLQLGLTLVSPFTDDRERLDVTRGPRYVRPSSGQVNGYIKFNWPDRRPSIRSSIPEAPSRNTTDDNSLELVECASSSRISNVTVMGPSPAPSMIISGSHSPITISGNQSPRTPEYFWSVESSPLLASAVPVPTQEGTIQLVYNKNEPKRIPPLFGLTAKMDRMDRQLWDFYIKNWCPGRSVLSATNLWLKDFARFQEDAGIRSAIQSLAGVYIYDYVPDERIRKRINQRYLEADSHFSRMLADPQSCQPGQGSDVIITMAVILSMQDIVLTEGRRKKPYKPRWLEGFMQGEYFLHVTDPGTRFWDHNNLQLDSLRLSQSIIVGRAVILAQPMMALPAAETLDPRQESSRFGWLLHPSEEEMFEIHGGCGFSLKLLHTMSQITYFAARMMQEPRGSVTPVTARFVHRELLEMRQWSRESTAWNQQGEATIDRFKGRPADFVIDNDSDMTDVTAEAWRFAAILYLQCRVLRLPRNHPEVLANLSNLAQCIRIMPTSGSQFTAQAPLLPVFFLGLLATHPDHKMVSRNWFEAVVMTPVRSSVPPLYHALTRIWNWMDAAIKIPHQPTSIPDAIGKRDPWWELLVATVHDKEEEMLCLT